MTQRILHVLVLVAAVGAIAVITAPGSLAERQATPRIGCDKLHPAECHRAITYWRGKAHDAERAAQWQKQHARHEVRRVLDGVRGAQPFAYAAKLAYAACLTFYSIPSSCKPPQQMLAVGRCESGLTNHDPNPTSSADGWLQFLDSTWANTVPAREGFSLYDPLAMAVAGEGMSRSGWHAWAASRGCHHLA